MATGGGGSGSGSGPSSETLDQARVNGDTFSGDVYWDNDSKAVFGRASGEVNVDYGQVYFDHTNHLFVFDSTKDGAGTVRPISWQMGGVEKASLAADGGMVLGSATGGSKGLGTVNVSGNYYVNGVAIATAGNAWVQGGNTFGADGVIGTLDAFPMVFKSDSNVVGRWRTDGAFVVGTDTAQYIGGRDFVLVRRDQNEHTAIALVNENTGNAALAAYALFTTPSKSCEMAITSINITPSFGVIQDACLISSISLTGGIKMYTRDASPITFAVDQIDIIKINTNTSVVFGGNGSQLLSEGFRFRGTTIFDQTATDAFSIHKLDDTTPVFTVDTVNSRVTLGASNTFGGNIEARIDQNGVTAIWSINETNGASAQAALGVIGQGGARSLTMNSLSDGAGGGNLLSSNGTTGLSITVDNNPLKIVTNAVTRYQIDGNGNMAWFGAGTVAQQGPIPDAAGGVVIDTQARAAINSLLAAMRNYALIAT